MAGHPWTGALGLGEDAMFLPDVSPSERDNKFQRLCDPSINFDHVTNAAAGWGHSVLVQDDKLYVAGRPYDFQSLLRLNRIPSFVRRIAINQTLSLDKQDKWGIFARTMDIIFRNQDNEIYKQGLLPRFTQMLLPDNDVPMPRTAHNTLAASAGLTAIVGRSGKLYTFGINQKGQCGIGSKKQHHCWEPAAVVCANGDVLEGVQSVDLGLQHGLALDQDGILYVWGKAARGQLGIADYKDRTSSSGEMESTVDVEYSAVTMNDFFIIDTDEKSRSRLCGSDAKVKKISAGWNHSAVITNSNHVFIWGKNMLTGGDGKGSKKPKDALIPTCVEGLPQNMDIIDISCGSHHTAILMEDGSVYGTGLATDTVQPIGLSVVKMIPAGLIDFPVRQFRSHFDRTTVIGESDGKQVLEVQLWSTEQLRSSAIFEPEWVDSIVQENMGIQMVCRGWQHTIIVTN
jgi:alpha-tubulin suppressor-like RCC1 family protein